MERERERERKQRERERERKGHSLELVEGQTNEKHDEQVVGVPKHLKVGPSAGTIEQQLKTHKCKNQTHH